LINETSIVNSHGISCAEKTTLFSCYLICMAKEMGKASSMVFEYEITRSIEKFSPTKLGEKAAEKAVASINPKSVESFEGQVLLDCDPAAVILAYPIMNSINADNVQRNRSLWAGRIGEEVANPTLSVVDDGLLPRGVYSSTFDDEGVPRQRTEILAKGVLKGYLHNSFTSNKENKASTGNAYRQNYATLPTVMASNMIIQPGNKKLEEIISEIDKGIIIRRFSGNVRPESGEFSGIAKQASLIENGEIKHALKETMIAGNTFEALKNIITIGSEIRATLYRAYVPPILVDKIKIVSK
jgi:PmbA protein